MLASSRSADPKPNLFASRGTTTPGSLRYAQAAPSFHGGHAAARVALGRAAAAAGSGCKQPDDPAGGGKVSVTFAPSGRVTAARVVGPPFAGTRIGGCIAATFRTATVPPFSGDPVVVTKDVVVR